VIIQAKLLLNSKIIAIELPEDETIEFNQLTLVEA